MPTVLKQMIVVRNVIMTIILLLLLLLLKRIYIRISLNVFVKGHHNLQSYVPCAGALALSW